MGMSIVPFYYFAVSVVVFIAALCHCYLFRVGCEGMESQSRRWNRSCTSDRPIPWIGVFWYSGNSVVVQGTLGACDTIHYPLRVFLPWVLPSHWIRGMRLRRVSHTPCLKEFLEYAGGERWPTIGTEFVWRSMEVISHHQYRLPCWNILLVFCCIYTELALWFDSQFWMVTNLDIPRKIIWWCIPLFFSFFFFFFFFLEGTKFLPESPMYHKYVSPPRHMVAPLLG